MSQRLHSNHEKNKKNLQIYRPQQGLQQGWNSTPPKKLNTGDQVSVPKKTQDL